jgi:hypothetical protein
MQRENNHKEEKKEKEKQPLLLNGYYYVKLIGMKDNFQLEWCKHWVTYCNYKFKEHNWK